jgi:Ankyrin repeat
MARSTVIAIVALLIGLAAGWKARYFGADGHDGIQWKLTDAAGQGDIKEMERLILAGADPLKFPSYADGAVTGATPLLEAAAAGEPEAVEFLINRGADVNLQESDVCPIEAAEHRLQQTERTVQILRSHIKARSEGFTTKATRPNEQRTVGSPH